MRTGRRRDESESGTRGAQFLLRLGSGRVAKVARAARVAGRARRKAREATNRKEAAVRAQAAGPAFVETRSPRRGVGATVHVRFPASRARVAARRVGRRIVRRGRRPPTLSASMPTLGRPLKRNGANRREFSDGTADARATTLPSFASSPPSDVDPHRRRLPNPGARDGTVGCPSPGPRRGVHCALGARVAERSSRLPAGRRRPCGGGFRVVWSFRLVIGGGGRELGGGISCTPADVAASRADARRRPTISRLGGVFDSAAVLRSLWGEGRRLAPRRAGISPVGRGVSLGEPSLAGDGRSPFRSRWQACGTIR